MVRSKSRLAAIYLRVSTDAQTTANQRHQLEAIAERRGWPVVKVYEDRAISGAKRALAQRGFGSVPANFGLRQRDKDRTPSPSSIGNPLDT